MSGRGWVLVACLLMVAGCGKPKAEAVLLVGRSVNAHWAAVLAPAIAAPDRDIRVVDVAGRTAASVLQPWLKAQQRLILVPLAVTPADPLVKDVERAVAGRSQATVVEPPDADDQMVQAIASRALRLSQRRSQEGLFVITDLPPGADAKSAQATVDRLAAKIAHTVDFRPVCGYVWQGRATASDVVARAKTVLRPLVVTYTVHPGPLSLAIRDGVHGVRYHLDGEGLLGDPAYREWLRGAVGAAATTVASRPRPQ